MMQQFQRAAGVTARAPRKWVIGRFGFAVALLAFEAAMIVAIAILTGIVYHLGVYRDVGEIPNYVAVGISTSLLFTLPVLFRDDYKFQDFLEGKRAPARAFMLWNYTFLCLAFIGLLTKTTGVFSRAWLVVFYIVGLAAIVAMDEAVSRFLATAVAKGRIASRRLMLVGAEDEIRRITEAVETPRSAFRVVASAKLPASGSLDEEAFQEVLTDAIDKARALGVEDVVILTDWSRGDFIQDLVDAFTVLPVAIHLGASRVIGTFSNARVARFGRSSALSLTSPPMGPLQSATKRIFDLVTASAAIVLLSPVLLAIGILVKWDSPGPIFFRQRRRGYNLREFRIWKFRTMTTMDDGDVVVQATQGDARVTRAGAVLRRLNLDELPQLFNVVTGEMSLVGPRPHAVAHDELFETRIAKYRRRLNVRPGITGWAQVNGLRGPTGTDAAMQARVEHDLYYIDNWSITFDLYVLAATVLSRKAFRNAV
jgi:Undecaprenyl-phosphate glucose phosphotransferase